MDEIKKIEKFSKCLNWKYCFESSILKTVSIKAVGKSNIIPYGSLPLTDGRENPPICEDISFAEVFKFSKGVKLKT